MNSYFVCSLFLLMLSSYLWFLEGETIGSHRHTTGFIPQLPTNDECTKSLARAVYIINLLFIGVYSFPKVFSVSPAIKRRRQIKCYSVANLCSYCKQQSQHFSKCISFPRFWFVSLILFWSVISNSLTILTLKYLYVAVGSDANSLFRVLIERI